MPAEQKVKSKKPLIKVEEIEEDVPNTEGDEYPKSAPSKPVSSFSQLDSAPPSPPDKEETKSEEKGLIDTPENKTASPDSQTIREEDSVSKDVPEKEQVSSEDVKEWLKDVRPDTTKEVEKGRGPGLKTIILIVITLLLLGAVVGGVLYYQKGVSQPVVEEAVPTQTQVQTATPTPEAEKIDLTKITVNVLNGSGIAGEAGKVKDLLVDLGFSDENVSTGNAAAYNFEDVSVSLKESASEAIYDEIKSALSENYEVSLSNDKLDENSDYDAVLTVGK